MSEHERPSRVVTAGGTPRCEGDNGGGGRDNAAMESVAAQLALMAAEAACVAVVLSALLRGRHVFGLAPAYMTLGVMFHLAGFLAGALYVQVTPTLAMSPGSVVLFPANIFVVLFVYIREDTYEARKVIYGLCAANVVTVLLGALLSHHLPSAAVLNPQHLSPEIFLERPRIALVGTAVLFVDTILIVLVYEGLRRVLRGHRLLPIWGSMVSVLAFDTLIFVTGSFVENPAYVTILLAGLIGKSAVGTLYAFALYASLRWLEPVRAGSSGVHPALGDVFQVLTYRERYEQLRKQAAKDPLTRVNNRGFFDEALPQALSRAKVGNENVSLLMIDVDHFKTINDQAGHQEGDRVLKAIAASLSATVRGSDSVCRFGGEEFAIILEQTSLAQAESLARRIQAAIKRDCHWQSDGQAPQTVTVTIGAATSKEAASTEALLKLADARLYAGKRAGRDRVVATDPLTAS